ncbi:YbaN family protein [Shewanella corallii]|uniref:Inner membrane protein n=2 Tax=Shewanella TaxID=22 RepID=A0ABT0NB32_9GAMM|nr:MULTISPECIES: YbaN family protein [Shewanella]MCL1037718.1 YbaN family protein [Shewanella submarina]MCL2915673.1 YbaN family protein [Shewanella corallii]
MIVKRGFFLFVGLTSLGLGVLGIVLPLLPTVPFILLSAYCFARSSERLHNWLHQHPWFAQSLKDWEQQRAVRPGLKRRAMIVSLISFSLSIYVVPLVWVKIMLSCFCVTLMIYLWRLPVIPDES